MRCPSQISSSAPRTARTRTKAAHIRLISPAGRRRSARGRTVHVRGILANPPTKPVIRPSVLRRDPTSPERRHAKQAVKPAVFRRGTVLADCTGDDLETMRRLHACDRGDGIQLRVPADRCATTSWTSCRSTTSVRRRCRLQRSTREGTATHRSSTMRDLPSSGASWRLPAPPTKRQRAPGSRTNRCRPSPRASRQLPRSPTSTIHSLTCGSIHPAFQLTPEATHRCAGALRRRAALERQRTCRRRTRLRPGLSGGAPRGA